MPNVTSTTKRKRGTYPGAGVYEPLSCPVWMKVTKALALALAVHTAFNFNCPLRLNHISK